MEALVCFILLMIIATFWRAALRVLIVGAVLVGALCYYVQTLDAPHVQGSTQQ